MLRGEIRWVDFDPARSGEVAMHRPAVIVSNDIANGTAARLGRGTVTVVPVTTNVAEVSPFQVALEAAASGLDRDSKAQAEQIRAVAVSRIGKRAGHLPAATLARLDDAIRIHLGL